MCPVCTWIVETEHHAINCCPDYAEKRVNYWEALLDTVPSIAGYTEKQVLGLVINPKKEYAALVGSFFCAIMDKVDGRYLVAA